jgi:hypothetical protein
VPRSLEERRAILSLQNPKMSTTVVKCPRGSTCNGNCSRVWMPVRKWRMISFGEFRSAELIGALGRNKQSIFELRKNTSPGLQKRRRHGLLRARALNVQLSLAHPKPVPLSFVLSFVPFWRTYWHRFSRSDFRASHLSRSSL